jgi:hypothetical protein
MSILACPDKNSLRSWGRGTSPGILSIETYINGSPYPPSCNPGILARSCREVVIRMLVNRYIRIVVILGMIVVLCSAPFAAAASMGIIAETHETSGVEAPVCTAPCECISESAATAKWGVNGYEMCSKTICGQSADAMVQYHCIHQAASTASAATTAPTQAPASGTAIPAVPAAAGITQKSPVGIVTILAAIGAVLLAATGMRRK